MEQQFLVEGANLIIASMLPLVGAFFMDLSNAVVINVFTSLPMMQEGLTAVGQ